MPENVSKNLSFVSHLVGGCRRNDDRLCIHHLAHYSTRAVRRAHQNRVEMHLLGGDALETTEERVRGRVAAGERNAKPSEQGAKEREQGTSSRERQAKN